MATHTATILRRSQVYSATSDGVKNLEKWDDDDELVRFAMDDTASSIDKSNRNVLQNARLILNKARLEVRHRWASISSNLNKAIVKTRRCSFRKGLTSDGIVEENGNVEDSASDETNSSHLAKDNAKPCLKQSSTLEGFNSKASSKHKRRTTFAPMGQKSNTLDYKSTNSKKNSRFFLRNNNQESMKQNGKIDLSNSKCEKNKEASQNDNDQTTEDHRDFSYMDDDPGIMSESETSATRNALGRSKVTKLVKKDLNSKLPSSTSINDIRREKEVANSLGLAFLHYQGETKRTLLPDEIRSLTDVKQLFAKAFRGSLATGYLQSPFVKIYIQDPTRQDVYYELEDLSEIRDRTVLKLHEQPRPTSPPAAANTFCPIIDRAPPSNQPNVFQPINNCNNEPNSVYGTLDVLKPQQDTKQDQNEIDPANTFPATMESQKFSSPAANNTVPVVKNCYGERSPRSLMPGHGERLRYSSAEPPAKPYRCFGGAKSSMGQYGRRRSRSPPNGLGLHNAGSESRIEPIATHDRAYMEPSQHVAPVYRNGTSDRSSSVSRCGSVTPVIDEEARVRMMNMETQLASLSSLVHSALMAKNVSDTVYKDIDMLRREILGTNGIRDDCSDTGSISRFSDRMSDNSQNIKLSRFFNSQSNNKMDYQQIYRQNQPECPTVKVLTPDAQIQLKIMKKRIVELNGDFRHLRRTVQLNNQATSDILKDSFDRIKLILNTNKQLHLFSNQSQQQQKSNDSYVSSDRVWVNQEQDKYRNSMKKVEQDLSEFEKRTEILRQQVVNGERRLRLTEIEELADTLTNIGRTTANLKGEFPSLQQRLKYVMTSEMDKVVREEKFLKDEPLRLDSALQKCKRLANTMLTMKKLAIVQDRPTLTGQQPDRDRPSSATPQSPQNADIYFPKSVEAPPLPPPPKNYHGQNGHTSFASIVRPSRAESDTKLFASKTIPNSGTQLLDSLLDELQNVSASNNVQNSQEKRRVDFVERFKNAASTETTASKITLNGNADSHNSNSNNHGIIDQPYHGNTRYGSESPNPVNRTQASSFAPKRCQSTTPLSQPSPMVPPPPPRSSSKTMLNGTSPHSAKMTPSSTAYSSAEIGEFKRQLSAPEPPPKAQPNSYAYADHYPPAEYQKMNGTANGKIVQDVFAKDAVGQSDCQIAKTKIANNADSHWI